MVVSTRRGTRNIGNDTIDRLQDDENVSTRDEQGTSEAASHADYNAGSTLVDSIADIFEKTIPSSTSSSSLLQRENDKTQHALSWKPDVMLPQHAREARRGASGAILETFGNSYRSLKTLVATKTKPEKNASKEWFELPAQEITDDVKTDLRVLRLRSAFDPKQFYKKFDETKFPTNFQFGRVVESSADYYSGRLKNKERKRTMAEEIMSDPHLAHVRKKRYTAIQEKAGYWSKQSYGRVTNNPRVRKKPKKAKH